MDKLRVFFDQLNPRQKAILLVVGGLIVLIFALKVMTPKNPQVTGRPSVPTAVRVTPQPTPVPAVFGLSPAVETFKVGESFNVDLVLNTGKYTVDAVDAILDFDPNLLRVDKIATGEIFATYPIKQIDNQAGTLQVSASAKLKDGQLSPFQGQGLLASITFRPLKAAEQVEINFDSNCIVASLGENRLDISQSLAGKYIINP